MTILGFVDVDLAPHRYCFGMEVANDVSATLLRGDGRICVARAAIYGYDIREALAAMTLVFHVQDICQGGTRLAALDLREFLFLVVFLMSMRFFKAHFLISIDSLYL